MRALSAARFRLAVFATMLIAFGVVTALGACGTEAPARAAASVSRPNIVVFMTDDETVAELRGMPNTRALLERNGVRFDRSYVSYPVCCPSRATYLTGQYAHNHGVMGLYPPTGGYGRFDKRNALPVWLARAGYHTAHLGKFLNGYGDQEPADVPPGWSDWHATVDYSTYKMWGYTMNDNGRMHTYGRTFEENPRLYQTDILAGKAAAIVRAQSRRGAPLFLSLNFLAPHHEARSIQRRTHWIVRPAPRHRRAFASAPLARTASFNEADMSDKPRFLRLHTHPLTRADIRAIQRDARARRAALLAADDGVKRVVDAVRRARELDNTYFIFTSDNGYMQGEHRVRSGKMLPYEPSTRVPLILAGPDIPQGRVSRELVANIDLAPTILDLAGATAGKTVDGRSLIPFARQPNRRTKRAILHETGGRKYVGPAEQDERTNATRPMKRILTYRAIRTARWLYVRWHDGSRELYDLRRDPDELNSLHAGRAQRHVRHVLARRLRALATCAGDSCRR
jgi:N-acetylglucosamine-6-sulfatase